MKHLFKYESFIPNIDKILHGEDSELGKEILKNLDNATNIFREEENDGFYFRAIVNGKKIEISYDIFSFGTPEVEVNGKALKSEYYSDKIYDKISQIYKSKYLNEELINIRNRIGKYTRSVDKIFDEPTSNKSLSSGILLKNKLKIEEIGEEDDIISTYNIRYSLKKKLSHDERLKEKLAMSLNNLNFLKNKLEENGILKCEYCPKSPLIIYDFLREIGIISRQYQIPLENRIDNPYVKYTKFNQSDGATADHKTPHSKGGDKYDYSNLAVCCYKCNMEKKNMTWERWKQIKKIN